LEIFLDFDVERFNPKKLSGVEVWEQLQIKIFKQICSFGETWENIKENVKISAKESLGLCEWKQHTSWFDEKCLKFLNQEKQANCSGCRIQTTIM